MSNFIKFFIVYYLQIYLTNIKYIIGENMFNFVSHNEEETKKIAKKIASKLQKGDIVILSRRFRFWQN